MKRSRARSQEAIEFARSQRKRSNEFASTVWQWIRNRQCFGQKFRREFPLPPYTVDFCCVELKLVIEIDGESHFTDEGLQSDRVRDQYLRKLGFRILRIPGYDILRDDSQVVERIDQFVLAAMGNSSTLPPAPFPEDGASGAKGV